MSSALALPERAWFHWHQALLLEMARTRYGRELLGVDLNIPLSVPVVAVGPHFFRARVGEHQWASEFRTHARTTRRILTFAKEFKTYRDYLFDRRHAVRDREEAARLGVPIIAGGATFEVNPNPDPENTSMDGHTGRTGVNENIATIRAGAGTTSQDTAAASWGVRLRGSATSDQWIHLNRSFYLFDTNPIPDIHTIYSAILSVMPMNLNNGLSGEDSPNSQLKVVSFSPASNTGVVDADHAEYGSVEFGAGQNQAGMAVDVYEAIVLNADGRGAVDSAGISKFGIMNGWDLFNTIVGLTWGSGDNQQVQVRTAETAGTTQDPKLEVVHSADALFFAHDF